MHAGETTNINFNTFPLHTLYLKQKCYTREIVWTNSRLSYKFPCLA